jgi:hypothetical protein
MTYKAVQNLHQIMRKSCRADIRLLVSLERLDQVAGLVRVLLLLGELTLSYGI